MIPLCEFFPPLHPFSEHSAREALVKWTTDPPPTSLSAYFFNQLFFPSKTRKYPLSCPSHLLPVVPFFLCSERLFLLRALPDTRDISPRLIRWSPSIAIRFWVSCSLPLPTSRPSDFSYFCRTSLPQNPLKDN